VCNPASAKWQKRWFGSLSLEELILIEKGALEDELRHILVRTLSPSCLSCGGREVSFFNYGAWGPHPDTGEEFRLSIEGRGHGINRIRHFYDVNGHPFELTDTELDPDRPLP
jgi:hypothetical protein